MWDSHGFQVTFTPLFTPRSKPSPLWLLFDRTLDQSSIFNFQDQASEGRVQQGGPADKAAEGGFAGRAGGDEQKAHRRPVQARRGKTETG
jgi:hypothetical protein